MTKYIALVFALILLSATVYQVHGINCYQCGTYSTTGAGSVSPCYNYDESHLKPCSNTDTHCLKYVNEGIIVRQCVAECKSGTQGQTEYYCCQEDGCNGAGLVFPHMTTLLFLSMSLASYIVLQ